MLLFPSVFTHTHTALGQTDDVVRNNGGNFDDLKKKNAQVQKKKPVQVQQVLQRFVVPIAPDF